MMSRNVMKTEGTNITSQYGAYAFNAGEAMIYERKRMRTLTRPGTHIHVSTQACASNQTQVKINTHYYSTVTMIRDRASLLHYTYIACLVKNQTR